MKIVSHGRKPHIQTLLATNIYQWINSLPHLMTKPKKYRKIARPYKVTQRPEKQLPQYKAWVSAVFKRDGYKCKMCGYKAIKFRHIQAHHIKRWADYPMLRYQVSNGITLCDQCHKKVWNKEKEFEALFLSKIGYGSSSVDLLAKMYENREKNEEI